MSIGILKQLFFEMFNVNHLMHDLIGELEETDNGREFLTDFYIGKIKDEFESTDLLDDYRKETSISCLNSLSETEYTNFCEWLYEEE